MYVYSGYEIAVDSAGSWSSSSQVDNSNNNLFLLGEGPTFGINGSFDLLEKKFSISFSKANTKFCLSLHYNADNSYLFVNGKKIFKVKADNKNVNSSNSILSRNYIQRS